MTDRVMVGIASIPEREDSLRRAVAALAPQADQVYVSLNGYREQPSWLSDFPNVEAEVRRMNGGDAEKFAHVDGWDGYVATCDDDILYPADYIRTLIAGIERYGRQRAVSFHGGTTSGFSATVHSAATIKRLRCLGTVAADDVDVNTLGTGVLGWHTAHVPIWRDLFRTPNMADVYLACHAHRMGIPLVVLAHKAGWLRDAQAEGPSIYESNRAADGTPLDTRDARRRELETIDWTQTPARPTVRVSIATCARPGSLLELLEDIAGEARYVDLEVCVYEDPTDASYAEARAFCEERTGWRWSSFAARLGVREHYRLVARELADAKQSKAEWFLFLPDDVRLNRHAIARAIDTWNRLDDPATLTLWRLASVEGKTNWTGRPAVQRPHASEIFHVDGLYLCQRPTLERLAFNIDDPRPPAGRSSGVGRQISVKLHRAGARMYRVDRSLVTVNDGGVSIMNPAEREKHPAVAL